MTPTTLEAEVIQQALPPHMLALAAAELAKKGWRLRPDIGIHLGRAAEAAFTCLTDAFSVSRVAKQVDDTALALMRDLNSDDPRDAILAVAFFVLKLVEAGLVDDVHGQAVLVSLHLMEDARAEGNEWRCNEAWLGRAAGSLLLRANLSGYFLGLADKPIAMPEPS